MEDRGEKIVTLARAMLNAKDSHQPPTPYEIERFSIPVKIIYLAAFLSACGGSLVTRWIDETRCPVSHYERVELDALVYYAAKTKGLSEPSIRREIERTFALPSFDNMVQSDYKRVRDFLRKKAK